MNNFNFILNLKIFFKNHLHLQYCSVEVVVVVVKTKNKKTNLEYILKPLRQVNILRS